MHQRRPRLPLIVLALGSAGVLARADDGQPSRTPPIPDKSLPTTGTDTTKRQPTPLELYFDYGSEKQRWIEAVTKRFNDSGRRCPTAGGSRSWRGRSGRARSSTGCSPAQTRRVSRPPTS